MRSALHLILISIFAGTVAFGDDYEPEIVDNTLFAALIKQSPFNRTLNLSGSLIITGLARIDDQQVVTLLDTQSKETHVVSSTPNIQGWKMVDVNPNDDLEMVTAKISLAGEVVNIRFGETKLKPGETRPSGGSPRTETKSSRPPEKRGPPEDIRNKIGSLSDEQKGKFFEKMKEIGQKHPEMSSEERSEAARKTLEKITKKDK